MVMGGRGQVYIIQRITTTYQANLAETMSKSASVQRRPSDGSEGFSLKLFERKLGPVNLYWFYWSLIQYLDMKLSFISFIWAWFDPKMRSANRTYFATKNRAFEPFLRRDVSYISRFLCHFSDEFLSCSHSKVAHALHQHSLSRTEPLFFVCHSVVYFS